MEQTVQQLNNIPAKYTSTMTMTMDDLNINAKIKEEIDIEQLPVTPYEYEWDVVMKIELEPEPEEPDASEPIHASGQIHASEPFDAASRHQTVTSTSNSASNNEYLQEILNASVSKSKSTQRPKRTIKSNKTHLSIKKSKSNINKKPDDLGPGPGADADADDKTFECSLCAEKNVKRIFKSNWQLRCHVEGIHEPPNHKCDVCFKAFGYESSLRRHRNLHSDEKGEFKFKCKICERPLSSKQQLLLHLLQKHSIEIKEDNTTKKTRVQLFVCHICSKSFQRRKLLESHILDKHVEDSQKPFECQLCSKKFVDALSCEQHLKKQHSKPPSGSGIPQTILHVVPVPVPVPVPKPVDEIIWETENNNTGIKCSLWSKTFESSVLLSVHQKVVHDSSKWRCKICQKPFSNARLLRKHTLTHQETRLIQQKLKSNPKINRSLFVPTSGNARKYKVQCKFCSEIVSCEQALKGHMAIYHGGDLPFKCQICGSGWISLSRLKIHAFSHTTEQRVKCKLCQMTVKHKEQLKRHTLKYHRDVKYPVDGDGVINRGKRKRTDTDNDNKNEIEPASEGQIQMAGDDTQAINEVQNINLPSSPLSQPEITIYQTLHSNVSGFGFQVPITFVYVEAHAQESEINNPNQITYYLEEEAAAASSVCESSTKKSRRSEIKTVIEPTSNPIANPILTHADAPIKKFECSTCPKSFVSYSGLKGHMRVEHNDGEVFKCSVCGSVWACQSRLDTHLLTHTTAERVKCQVCFATVKHREQLRRHMQSYHRNHLDGRNLRKKPTAVVSKYSGNEVFVCYNKKCSFEGRNQEEVALHYQEHDLPKVLLNDCCYTRPVSQTNTKVQVHKGRHSKNREKSKAGGSSLVATSTKPVAIPDLKVGRKNCRYIHPLKMIRKR